MADVDAGTKPQYVYCRDCGAEVREEAEICPECGIRQKGESVTGNSSSGIGPGSGDLTEQYSIAIWIASLLFGLLTFPVGLIIPAYFFIKAKNGTGGEQSGLEAWTVVLTGVFGIAAVEIGGEKGAKILWGIFGALLVLVFLIAFAAAL